jgi:hypothetical protein
VRGSVKKLFNPLIEKTAITAFGVDQYADIFEKLALSPRFPGMIRRVSRRHLPDDLAQSNLLFIHVPKNGGTSVKRALYRSDPGHASIRYYSLYFPAFLKGADSFAILRDPVDRFLSGFDFLLNGGGGDVSIRAEPMRRMRHIGSIDALLDYLERLDGDWLKADTFVRPQSWYIADPGGIIRVDRLWLLECAGSGLLRFLRDHGIPLIPHLNQTRRAVRILEFGQIERLRTIYADDFALYAEVSAAGGYSGALAGMPVNAANRASISRSTAA